jgi:AAA15 family ATPase/GTPase
MTIAQSETTKTDSPKDSGFYSGITIEGFRQFNKLELTNLGKVNLVLGPNNAGKTSILEAVYIHACHGNMKLIFDNLLLSRISQTKSISGFLEIGEQVISLFNKKNHLPYHFTINKTNIDDLPNYDRMTIVFKPSKRLSQLDPRNLNSTYQVLDSSTKLKSSNRDLLGNWRSTNNGVDESNDVFFDTNEVNKVSVKMKNGDSIPQNIQSFAQNYVIFHDILAHREPQATVAIFSHLKRYRLLEKFTKEMKAVFPIKEIDSIPYPDGSFSPIYIINSNDELLPIYNFGDGMRRWFHLLGNLMIYPNSVHLIEEIDATFHPNAQEKFGHLLVEYAEKFNNQLFMTSHNLEFADKFLESLYGEEGSITQDQDDPVRVITIGQSRDDPEETTVWNLTGRQAYRGRKLYNVELR